MKKSEKIEIRLSLPEKETLTQLAANEGRSVSQLVRDVVNKYTALNIATPRPKLSKGKIYGAIALCLFFGGVIGTLMPNFSNDKDPLYEIGVDIGETTYLMDLNEALKKEGIFGFGPNHPYKFGIKLSEDIGPGHLKKAIITVCDAQPVSCENNTSFQLDLNPLASTSFEATTNNGSEVSILIRSLARKKTKPIKAFGL